MKIKLQKWGNSFGIRLPKNILNSMNIKENDILTLEMEDNKILITKSNKQKVSLRELFEKYNGEDLTKDFSWDESVGNEIW